MAINYGSSLTQQEATKFRAWIGVRVEALLDGYWQNRPADIVKAEIIKDWMAGLQQYSPNEIIEACRQWQRTEPRKKPNVGDICKIILSERYTEQMRLSPPEPPPEPERVTAEQASSILEKVGFKARKFGTE